MRRRSPISCSRDPGHDTIAKQTNLLLNAAIVRPPVAGEGQAAGRDEVLPTAHGVCVAIRKHVGCGFTIQDAESAISQVTGRYATCPFALRFRYWHPGMLDDLEMNRHPEGIIHELDRFPAEASH